MSRLENLSVDDIQLPPRISDDANIGDIEVIAEDFAGNFIMPHFKKKKSKETSKNQDLVTEN